MSTLPVELAAPFPGFLHGGLRATPVPGLLVVGSLRFPMILIPPSLRRLGLALSALLAPSLTGLAAEPALPPDSAYVQISPEGRLVLEGRRVRFWGSTHSFISPASRATGAPEPLRFSPDDTPEQRAAKAVAHRAAIDTLADRLAFLGINMVRPWDSVDWAAPYQAGDNSRNDLFAYALAAFEKRGIRIWSPQLNSVGRVTPEDVSVLDEPASADAWREAVAGMAADPFRSPVPPDMTRGNPSLGGILADYWDPRLQALRLQRQERVVNFRNHHKGGLRLADDPQFVVWELTNEEWWFAKMVNGRWRRLPAFFQQSLLARWCDFLRGKYGDEAGLREAWGKLAEGETLAANFVMLAPLAEPVNLRDFNDVNPAAIAAQQADATPQPITRANSSPRRAQDVIEFLATLQRDWKRKQRLHLETLGKSLRLSAIVYDTGDEWRIQSAWMQQDADAVAMSAYGTGFGRDPKDPLFPFSTYLRGGQPMYSAADRMPGKPYFVYETSTLNPSKYRAEFPYFRAFEGIVQDIDIILWHTLPNPPFGRDGAPPRFGGRMQLSRPDFGPGGYEMADDEVRSAALVTAGALFTSGKLEPAPSPATITWGRNSILDPGSLRYGTSYGPKRGQLSGIALRQGLRHRYDLERADDEVSGLLESAATDGGQRPTSQIEYDRRRWHIRADSPRGVAYTGFLARLDAPLAFSNGVRVEDVRIENPPAMPYPVRDDERFISFGLASLDGRELGQTRRARLTLVSTSFNEGMVIDETKLAKIAPHVGGQAVTRTGGQTLVARVGATLRLPPLHGADYTLYDFNQNVLRRGRLEGDDTLRLSPGEPVFLVEFTRPGPNPSRPRIKR